jgi:dTDP-4-dehydrorhamnose 3,5-epimerase
MIFEPLNLDGAYLIKPELHEDGRGFFARSFCKKEFEEQGLTSEYVQCNISFNRKKGTLRGMHFQKSPHAETKLIHCITGSIFDVIIDLRPDSQTFKEWVGIELCSKDKYLLYVPEGFAHGFLTLSDDTEIFYQISEYYSPEYSDGVRWDDPTFNIEWPINGYPHISEKDKEYLFCNGK